MITISLKVTEGQARWLENQEITKSEMIRRLIDAKREKDKELEVASR